MTKIKFSVCCCMPRDKFIFRTPITINLVPLCSASTRKNRCWHTIWCAMDFSVQAFQYNICILININIVSI